MKLRYFFKCSFLTGENLSECQPPAPAGQLKKNKGTMLQRVHKGLIRICTRYRHLLGSVGFSLLICWLIRWKRWHRLALAWFYGLSKPACTWVVRDHIIPMSDGAGMATTVYRPVMASEGPLPTVLIRTPYCRQLVDLACTLLVERGYNVVCQDTRGRWGSDGEFTVLKHDMNDGKDTLKWIKQQFPGSCVGMFGISYLGYTQWAALAGTRGLCQEEKAELPELVCLAPLFSSSDMFSICFPNGSVSLDFLLRWLYLTYFYGGQGLSHPRPRGLLMRHLPAIACYQLMEDRTIRRASMQTCFEDMHSVAFGRKELLVPFVPEPEDVWWGERSHAAVVRDAPPTHIIGGWYDFFLPGCLKDFMQLQQAHEEYAYGGDEGTRRPRRRLKRIYKDCVGKNCCPCPRPDDGSCDRECYSKDQTFTCVLESIVKEKGSRVYSLGGQITKSRSAGNVTSPPDRADDCQQSSEQRTPGMGQECPNAQVVKRDGEKTMVEVTQGFPKQAPFLTIGLALQMLSVPMPYLLGVLIGTLSLSVCMVFGHAPLELTLDRSRTQ